MFGANDFRSDPGYWNALDQQYVNAEHRQAKARRAFHDLSAFQKADAMGYCFFRGTYNGHSITGHFSWKDYRREWTMTVNFSPDTHVMYAIERLPGDPDMVKLIQHLCDDADNNFINIAAVSSGHAMFTAYGEQLPRFDFPRFMCAFLSVV
jgi:hypothetical protein